MDPNFLPWLFLKQFYPLIVIILLVLFKYITCLQVAVTYLIFCCYWYFLPNNKLLYNKTNTVISSILKKCPIITSLNYQPPFFFALNPFQLVLLASSIVTPKQKVKVTRQNIGECGVTLDWVEYEGISNDRTKPILIILPGLTGGVKDAYVMNMVDQGIKNGYNVAIYQMRVLSPNVKLPQDGTHFNLFDDVDKMFDEVLKKYGNDAKIYAIGFSYGANQIVRYLGEYNYKHKKVQGAVSISNPYDFMVSSRISKDTLYDRMLLFFLQKVYKKVGPALVQDKKLNINDKAIKETTSLHTFDKYFTAPILGFDSPSDYYRNIGCARFIKNVDVPLLCIHSLDDAVTSSKVIPYDDIELNSNVVLLTTGKGTHSCFLEDDGIFRVKQWVPKPAVEFINAIHNNSTKQ